jgi:serine/threonine-protein kinase
MDLSPRAVIAGRYRVDTKVGAGGMGEVWLGEHIAVGVRVAVKTLLPAVAMNHEVVARFKREAYLLGRIRSDHVARVVDFVADDVYGLVLVMEFIDGDPLSKILQERTLTVEEGIELAVGLATALRDLHAANIIHRDLKPGNIIMQPTPEGRRRAVVVDFGVSRLMADKDKDEDEELTGITRADMAVGTIEYMAPEQILNSRNVTPASDLYAAGSMLFRSCAGRHVFGVVGSDAELAQKKLTTEAPALPLARHDRVSEGFAAVVAKMIKRRPSERYRTADAVLVDLLPIRDLARAEAADLEGTTLDAVKGTAVAKQLAAMPGPAQAAQPAATPPPVTPKPTNTAPLPSPVAPGPASVAAPQPAAVAAQSALGRDTGIGVTAPQPSKSEPARRGVSPVVTFGLVAVALAGGVFIGPKVLQSLPLDRMPIAIPGAAPTTTVTANATATATASPTATANAAESATATTNATESPTATASAAAATASAAATSAPAESASAATGTTMTLVPEAPLPTEDAGAGKVRIRFAPRPVPTIP